MNCRECEDQLSAYLDHDLAADQAAAVRAHLAGCAGCLALREDLELLTKAAAGLPRPEPSTKTVLKVKESIQGAGQTRRQTEFGPVLDVEELMAYLHIDDRILEIYIGELPCFELGGKLLFRRDSIDAWIRTREQHFAFAAQTAMANLPLDEQEAGGTTWTL